MRKIRRMIANLMRRFRVNCGKCPHADVHCKEACNCLQNIELPKHLRAKRSRP